MNIEENLKKSSQKEIEEIKNLFLDNYPDSKTELSYKNLYELIVSVILSAQCTDRRVNVITPALFEKYPDIESLADANLNDVRELIRSCSYFNNKAKKYNKDGQERLLKILMERSPLNRRDLMTLAGVGQKTANVVLIEYVGDKLYGSRYTCI